MLHFRKIIPDIYPKTAAHFLLCAAVLHISFLGWLIKLIRSGIFSVLCILILFVMFLENKAKIANLYSEGNIEIGTIVKMSEITIDGEQLKLNIGEDFKMEK